MGGETLFRRIELPLDRHGGREMTRNSVSVHSYQYTPKNHNKKDSTCIKNTRLGLFYSIFTLPSLTVNTPLSPFFVFKPHLINDRNKK